MLHHYAIDGAEALRFAELVAGLSRSSIQATQAVSRRRADTLPLTALVLARLLRRIRPAQVVFSANGLREGAMFELASQETRLRDPLIDLADRFGRNRARDPAMGDAMMTFLDPLYADEPASDRRLRAAACALADIGWRHHPDYRAEMAFDRVMFAAVSGADHAERAFVAHAVRLRYGGDASTGDVKATLQLLDPERRAAAQKLGRAQRLGFA